MDVVLLIMMHARWTLAKSPPGTTVGGWLLIPTLKAVGHQSTNWMVRLDLTAAMEELTSLGDDISTVHQNARHVLSVARVTLHHHRGWFEHGGGQLRDRQLFVVGFLCRDDRGVRAKRETNAWVWHQVGLERRHVHVDLTIETQARRDGGNDLSNQSVQVGVRRALNVEGTTADVIQGFVVHHKSNITMFKHTVRRQDVVVWLDNSGGDLWGWVDGESELGFFTVIDGKSLEEKGSESGTGSSTDGVEDEETLESSALIGKLSDSVEAEINDFFTNGVMSSGEVVSSIFFTGDKLFWMEQLSVGSGSDFIDNGWLEIEEDGSWDVFTSTSLGEEGVEGIVTTTDRFISRQRHSLQPHIRVLVRRAIMRHALFAKARRRRLEHDAHRRTDLS